MVSVRGNQTNNKVTASALTSTNNRAEVKPVNINNQVEATNNLAKYYSEISQDWAVGEGLIQNIDYSSKTYALQAKEYANNAKESMEITEEYMDNAISNIQTAETNALNSIVMQEESALSTVNQGVDQLNTTITEGLDSINTSVTEGVETIETLQSNSIAEITTNKESALSDITTAETNVLNNIDTDLTNATNEINTNRANTLAQISTLANTSISDINAVGKSYDNLTYRNITNCLLEVPQRIKYTLENGTLTVKAGSVVIVPYGTEDKTSELPVGATFINDNFKVYDTQYTEDADGNGKFFVWAELVNDISHKQATSSNEARLLSLPIINETSIPFAFNVCTWSGATAPPTTAAYQWYDTANNKCVHTNKTTGNISIPLLSLPILIVSSNGTDVFGSVNQVFNGMGYIGSIKWIDKGVKMLCSDGINKDGTYKNTEYTTPNLKFYFGGTAETTYHAFYNIADTYLTTVAISQEKYTFDVNSLSEISIKEHIYATAYVRPENRFYVHQENTTDWKPMVACKIGTHTNLDTNGNVGSFNPKQPFRAVDYNDIDGEIIVKSMYVVKDTSWEGKSYTYDLSDYLPKDDNKYEVLFSALAQTPTTGNSTIYLNTDFNLNKICVARGTGNGKVVLIGGNVRAVVGTKRSVTITNTSNTAASCELTVLEYRKVR